MAYPIDNTLRAYFLSAGLQTVAITVTPKTGEEFTLTNADIVAGSCTIDRAGASGKSIELGACMANELTFSLENNDGRFSGIDWTGAELAVRIGNGTASIPMGVFIVDEAPKKRTVMSIAALDRMANFDKYISASTLESIWDADPTIAELVSRCCELCGVTLASNLASYPNADYTPPILSNEQDLTYRQLIMYCCGIMGKCGYMDWNGHLRIGFPEADPATPDEVITEAERYTSELEDYSIEVTGVMYVDSDSNVIVYGTEDYAYDLSDNPFASEETIEELTDLIGLSYTPFTASTLPLPHLYPYDWIQFDRGEDTFYGILTSVTYKLNGGCRLASIGESPTANERANVARGTATLIRKTKEIVDERVATSIDIAKANTTALIRNAGSGHIYHEYVNDAEGNPVEQAMYIIDGNAPATSEHQWRWNINGFGYSEDYGLTYGTAITMDGQIVADYITAGTMNANIIRTGILRAQTGGNYWNLDTGELHIETLDIDAPRIFMEVPTPPYSEGDLWYRGETGDCYSAVPGIAVPGYAIPDVGSDLFICTTEKMASGQFSISDWDPTFEGQIKQIADVNYRVRSAEFNINNATGEIQLLSSYTNALTDRTTQAEIRLDAAEQQISLKVSKTDYNAAEIALMINNAGSTVKIQADHIRLEGIVTVNSGFKIKSDGSMEATGAVINGDLNIQKQACTARVSDVYTHQIGIVEGRVIQTQVTGFGVARRYHEDISYCSFVPYYSTYQGSSIIRPDKDATGVSINRWLTKTRSTVDAGNGGIDEMVIDVKSKNVAGADDFTKGYKVVIEKDYDSLCSTRIYKLGPNFEFGDYYCDANLRYGVLNPADFGSDVFFVFNDGTYPYNHGYHGFAYSDGKLWTNDKEVATVSTSSIRYKEDIALIEDSGLDPHRLLDLPVKQFRYKDGVVLQYDDTEGMLLPGFIAEDVADIYPSATIHRDDDIESWDERRIIPGMLALIQELYREVQALKGGNA